MTTYNYAENRVPNGIDLHGLQFVGFHKVPFVEGSSEKFVKENPVAAVAIPLLPAAVVGISTGGGTAAAGLAGALYTSPELVAAGGAFVWGLGTDADMPGAGDEVGRAVRNVGREVVEFSAKKKRKRKSLF